GPGPHPGGPQAVGKARGARLHPHLAAGRRGVRIGLHPLHLQGETLELPLAAERLVAAVAAAVDRVQLLAQPLLVPALPAGLGVASMMSRSAAPGAAGSLCHVRRPTRDRSVFSPRGVTRATDARPGCPGAHEPVTGALLASGTGAAAGLGSHRADRDRPAPR